MMKYLYSAIVKQDKGLCFLGISHYLVVIFIFVYRVLSLANPRF